MYRINKLSKIFINTINEAFDFNEIKDEEPLIINDLRKYSIAKSVKNFMKKYFDFGFDCNLWEVYENKEDNYFLMIPKNTYENLVSYSKYGTLGSDIVENIENILPADIMRLYINTSVKDTKEDKVICEETYHKIRKEIKNVYFKNMHGTFITNIAKDHALFYSRKFMVFKQGNNVFEPPLIYIKSTTDFKIDESEINQINFFSSVFLNSVLPPDLIYVLVNNIYTFYNYNLLMLSNFNGFNLLQNAKLLSNHNIFKTYLIFSNPNIGIITLESNNALLKAFGSSSIKRLPKKIIVGAPGMEHAGITLSNNLYEQYKTFIMEKIKS